MSGTISIDPPHADIIELVSALSNPSNHDLHVQAIAARDKALSENIESYGRYCLELARLLWASDDAPSRLPQFQQDQATAVKFGQLGGFILKQALSNPPTSNQQRHHLIPPTSDQVKQILLSCLWCRAPELRSVASSVIASVSVNVDSLQPNLSVSMWPQLVPTLLQGLQSSISELMHGSLITVQKIMEDGPEELSQQDLDSVIPALVNLIQPQYEEQIKVAALKSIWSCAEEGLFPNALVLQFNQYLQCLSNLATDSSSRVRTWVLRSLVTILVLRTEYMAPHMEAISQFILTSTASESNDVALEACEFWLTFTTLDGEEAMTPELLSMVERLLPQLIPILLKNMVYSQDQQIELEYRVQLELQEADKQQQQVRPVFYSSKKKHQQQQKEAEDSDDDDFDDDEDNEWTLRKCSAASLDAMASLYGPQPILPCLLPALEQGLSSSNLWEQEASVLALGAIADGCLDAMYQHLGQLFPFLLNILQQPEVKEGQNATALPQLKCIAAWTIGRYSSWAVEQVQQGVQGHLLASISEVLMERLNDCSRVQVACGSAFGVVVEKSGDLMVPYLEPVYRHIVSAIPRFHTKPLLIVFDVMGIMADFVGPAIGEGSLPAIYVPPLLHVWNETANINPADKTLLPLMESLASVAIACNVNYQPFALETFENAMAIIECVTLLLANTDVDFIQDDSEADHIVCATDLLDGLVEGLGPNFATLVSSSSRYGSQFCNVLVALIDHEVPSVRQSAFALVGDLVVNCPSIIEPALPKILEEGISNLDPMHGGVCNNAVWAIGEVCVRCGENSTVFEPFASDLLQELVAILNSASSSNVPGVTENTAATMGRLAKLNVNFVAQDLPRFLMGWCDGMAKVTDKTERQDAYEGFVLALRANPQAIFSASSNVVESVAGILFAVVSWHLPFEAGHDGVSDVLHNQDHYTLEAGFAPHQAELQKSLALLMADTKNLIGTETWKSVEQQVPVNVKRLLRETYHL